MIILKKAFAGIFILILFLSPLSHVRADGEIHLNNSIDTLSVEEKRDITMLLTACADIMHFDSSDYDFDTLIKYILCTHANFAVITGLSPETNISGSGADGISIVNGDYIDSIVTNIFKLKPEHPSVDALVDRGFCYSNGMYYYRNIFTADFYTQIQDLTAVYKLGGGTYYVVFNDIYYENGKAAPEQSFAVIRKSSPLPYSLIRLGMGEGGLSDEEILAYTPQKTYENPVWQTPSPDYTPSRKASLGTLIVVISAAALIFIAGTIALIREIKKK